MARQTETRKYDVVVIGGGMSGITAALASARGGAKTALIQNRSVLGGNASSEIRIHISGASDSLKKPELEEGGILYELMLENKVNNTYFSYPRWDAVLFGKVRYQKGLDLFLDTVLYDAESSGRKIDRAFCYQATTEKHFLFEAPLFIDATGNGTLGFFAGAAWMRGSESRAEYGEPHAPLKPDQNRMGNSILFRAVNRGRPVAFNPPPFARKFSEDDLRLRVHSSNLPDFSQAPDPEDYKRVSAFSSAGIEYGYWWIELMGEGDDIIPEFETIREDLYACVYGIWDHIKNGGDHGAENYDLEWVGALPGMRESRRLRGDYILNERDILENRIFEDAVCYGGWGVDLHAPRGLLDTGLLPSRVWTYPGAYTIPYRCYYSANIDNLFMAGRNISASRLGMASARVIGTCALGGQAVGSAAALCIREGLPPRALGSRIGLLQQQLLKDDGFLPGFRNQDPADYAREARFSASSFAQGGEPEQVINGISRRYEGQENAWICEEAAGAWLRADFSRARTLRQIRLTFDTNFSYPIRITMAPARQRQQRPGVPPELVRDFDLIFLKDGAPVKTVPVRGNLRRLCVVDLEPVCCDCLEIRILATHGAKKVCIFEVRAY